MLGKWCQLMREWGTRPLGDILLEQYKRFLIWWKKTTPNPWPRELDEAMNDPDAEVLCSHCFTPQKKGTWFCPKCGAAVGPYNNTMPFLPIFSIGEMVRAGTDSHLKKSPVVIIGYVLVALTQYMIFAPVFLYRFVRNRCRTDAAPPADEESGS